MLSNDICVWPTCGHVYYLIVIQLSLRTACASVACCVCVVFTEVLIALFHCAQITPSISQPVRLELNPGFTVLNSSNSFGSSQVFPSNAVSSDLGAYNWTNFKDIMNKPADFYLILIYVWYLITWSCFELQVLKKIYAYTAININFVLKQLPYVSCLLT
jgi:hypothetical protein